MNTFSKSSTALLLALAACALTSNCGCGPKNFKPSKIFSLDNAWPFEDDEEEPKEGIPVRIVGAWTDTVMSVPGQKAQRGFGGRLMFYAQDDEKPILVNGQLVIYAFDEMGRAPTDNRPTRRYVFPPDQVKMRMSKNDMGASYSFWLPWDEAGGPKADVSLICRFEPKGGAVITGEQTRHILPGAVSTDTPVGGGQRVPEGVPMRPAQMTLESYQAQQQVPGGVQTANYVEAVGPQPTSGAGASTGSASALDRQMSVTSIALPRDFQMPDGAHAQPIAAATEQASATRQAMPSTSPAQNLQPQYQQPSTTMQPVMHTPHPPAGGPAVIQQPLPQAQSLQPNGMGQRPTIAPINTPGIYVPQNQGFATPGSTPQYVAQQPVMAGAPPMAAPGTAMVAPAPAYSRMPAQHAALNPQQPIVAPPIQQMTAMPTQPMIPPQSYQQPGLQQLPAAKGVRTAVSYGPPATIPWR